MHGWLELCNIKQPIDQITPDLRIFFPPPTGPDTGNERVLPGVQGPEHQTP